MSVMEELFSRPQYSLPQSEKVLLLDKELKALTDFHSERCEPYRYIIGCLYRADLEYSESLAHIPYIPVRLFKTLELKSVSEESVQKKLTSSGTSSQSVSIVAVDKETSILQTKALVSIVSSFIGGKRLPMVILDTKAILRDRSSLSARGAGLLGFSNFGRDHFYALDNTLKLDIEGLKAYVQKYHGERILIFGFTHMVWHYLYRVLGCSSPEPIFDDAVLIHGGGWKKLQEEAVTNEHFKAELKRCCGIDSVYNYYGMVEQVGSIYMECECGYLHAPNFADILIRDYREWGIQPVGEVGVIQTLSVLPRSYPGHSLLTEDLGVIHGIDDCPCGRKGTYFSVLGRIPKAELRGCSDTYAYNSAQTPKTDEIQLTCLLPAHANIAHETLSENGFYSQAPMAAFEPLVLEFLDELSKSIFRMPAVKDSPEFVALAYWLRKANIKGIIDEFTKGVRKNELVLPRGMAFHVAPSNVDTIFIYSWALSLLAGNLNVVRVSRAISPQLQRLLDIISTVMASTKWNEIVKRNRIMTYPRDERINAIFSSYADVRIVWGGDATIQSIRTIPTKPGAMDIAFADKVSYATVRAERYISMDHGEKAEAARLFYNDAYYFNQMACSSPRLVYFVGDFDTCEEASKQFWVELGRELERRRASDEMSVAIDKLVFTNELAAGGVEFSVPYGYHHTAPAVNRITLDDVPQCRNTCGGGLFFECFIEHIIDLAAVVRHNDQTLSYVGFSQDDMMAAAKALGSKGINRIVPFGKALAFSHIWDGYVLLNELTKRLPVL